MNAPVERVVGNDPNAPFVGYGDDSQHENTLAFALVILPRPRVPTVQQRIEEIKRDFKFPPGVPLHCRQLMHPVQRQKVGLDHLNEEGVRSVIGAVLGEFNSNLIAVRYGVAGFADMRDSLGREIELRSKDGQTIRLPVDAQAKGLLGLLANSACVLAPNDGSQGPPPTHCEFVLAEDRTKTAFIGLGRRQAHSRYTGFSEIGAAEGEILRFAPHIGTWSAYPLLQLADVASYACAHLNDQSERGNFFRSQLSRLDWLYRSQLTPDRKSLAG